jgi:hypothetical protein
MRVSAFKREGATAHSGDRLRVVVDIFRGADQVGGGSTAGETRDMNDALEFLVEKNNEYTLKYWLPDGTAKSVNVAVKDLPVEVKLY